MSKKTKTLTLISIDLTPKTVTFSAQGTGSGSKLTLESVPHKAAAFTADFYKELSLILLEYAKKHTSMAEGGLIFLLPDRLVAMELIQIPTMRGRKVEQHLGVSLDGTYHNRAELEIKTVQVVQNKQQTMFAAYVLRKEIIAELKKVCENAKLVFCGVTFASASTAAAVGQLNSHLRTGSYLLMDLKSEYTRVTFVIKGRAAGCYQLPFGSSSLHRHRLSAEDMLFDHSTADLIVLNAKEKAKAKQLTMMQDSASDPSLTEGGADQSDVQEAADAVTETSEFAEGGFDASASEGTQKVLRKTPRKLPKFMLRPVPETEDGFMQENFRIFVKWALNLLADNDKVRMQGKIDTVYVRMPAVYDGIYDMVNIEKTENGVEFLPLDLHQPEPDIAENLEMFGALTPDSVNKLCLF